MEQKAAAAKKKEEREKAQVEAAEKIASNEQEKLNKQIASLKNELSNLKSKSSSENTALSDEVASLKAKLEDQASAFAKEKTELQASAASKPVEVKDDARVGELQSENESLKAKVSDLEGRVASPPADGGDLASENASLKDKEQELLKKVGALEQEVAEVKVGKDGEIEELSKKKAQLEEEVVEVGGKLNDMRAKVRELVRVNDDLEEELENTKTSSGSFETQVYFCYDFCNCSNCHYFNLLLFSPFSYPHK